MKKRHGHRIMVVLILFLLIPFVWSQNVITVSAATPAFKESKIEIVGVGETHQLEIKNKVDKSTYKWTSSNAKVAKVNSKGLVTSVDKGSATIKCKIVYPNGKSTTISCSVTVKIPATGIKINNAKEVNGAHILQLGEKFNFNRDIIPSNSTDKTYWSVGGGDASCIRIDSSSSGIVTAVKVGKVVLKATAAKESTAKAAATSIVDDAIIIEVVGPSATVNSVEIVNSDEIKVVFDSAVNRSTIIDSNNRLRKDSIEVTLRKDTKGVLAEDPGAMTASLSSDMKTLTIKTENMLNGQYGISFSENIKTMDGLALEPYYKHITYIDVIPPFISEVSLDDTGMITTITFSETIDFSNFKVSNPTLVPTSTSTTVDQSTLRILDNELNYVISKDKKSISINLSKIPAVDYGKIFTITISGIKDLSGNIPKDYTLTTNVFTDITKRPQARPYSITRTGYKTLTAAFDRAIQSPGMITINNGSFIIGTVDAENNKLVNFTIPDQYLKYEGMQTVSIAYWKGYNVDPSDNFANQLRSFTVDFTAEKTNPVLITSQFDPTSNILTLTYNEDVTLSRNSGIFNSILVTNTDDIISGTMISYTKMESTDPKVVKLLMTNMSMVGTYKFTLEQGFVYDNFGNPSLGGRDIVVNTISETTNELPGPYLIKQSDSNLSQITLHFTNKLDIDSAQNINNYRIPGVTILSAQVINNTNNAATVLLTVADGSIDVTVERPITITGLKGYNNSYTEILEFSTNVLLKDNKRPYFTDQVVFDKKTPNIVKLIFSEPIKGTMAFKVTQYDGTNQFEMPHTVSVSGNTVIITLGGVPKNNTYLRIDVIKNEIIDESGNTAPNNFTTTGVYISY